ncbi:MAG: helix-turn-helix domain-containing protein [Burkholderiales bacterium]|nr:helix-turn-helix domain-containing protein [Burkholderiales bacterium]
MKRKPVTPAAASTARSASLAPTGTQALERGVQILRELATRPRVGWGLTELALRCELDKATTYRILTGLVRTRMATKHTSAPRYLPGPLLFELGLAIVSHDQLRAAGRDVVGRVARRLGGISALTLASGFDAVCCAHAGKVSTKALSFAVGDRRPLVMNSAGVSMLICLPAAEMHAASKYGLARSSHLGSYRVGMIRAMIDRSARLGYGLNQDYTVAGITGVAVAILDISGQPVASLSISGTSAQFPENAIADLVSSLRHESAALEQLVATSSRFEI